MTNVNRSLSESRTKQFTRFFIDYRGKFYTFILTIYCGLFRSVAMLLNETCTYQVTAPKSVVNVPK
jgi:hypothetical protein